MYFDPDWIFANKPEKQYPNISGLMINGGIVPEGKPRKKKGFTTLNSLADVFKPHAAIQPQQKVAEIEPPVGVVQKPVELPGDQSEYRKIMAPIIIDKKERKEWGNEFLSIMEPARRQYLDIVPKYSRIAKNDIYRDKTPYIKLSDNKYNIRNNLKIDPFVLDELKKFAQAGGLTPEQTLMLAAVASSESEFGRTRDLFGINDAYMDFGPPTNIAPGSYEQKMLDKWYTGDMYSDYMGFLSRKTNQFTDWDGINRNFYKDRKINPSGETYTERLKRYADILLNNPDFLKALFGGNIPQLNLPSHPAVKYTKNQQIN